MDNRDIYNIISGIDEKYRACSEDFDRISGNFKHTRIRRIEAYATLAASFVLVVFAGLNVYDKNSMIQREDMISPSFNTVSVTEQTSETKLYDNNITTMTSTDKADNHTAAAVSSVTENTKTSAKKKGSVNKNSGEIKTDNITKNTAKPASSKVTSKTENKKTSISSRPATTAKSKPAVTTAAVISDEKPAVTDKIPDNEGFEDPVLDEIVMSNNLYDYTYLTGNRIYVPGSKKMDADSVGEKIDKNITLRKYSVEDEKIYYMTADTYKINNISDEFAVAVKYPKIDTYFLYRNINYSCDSFGQLMDDLDFEHNLSIDKMYDYRDGVLYGITNNFDKDILRKFIFENKDAEYLSNVKDGYEITFFISIDLLNISTHFSPSRSGYFKLNLRNGQTYYFKLSRDAFQELMDAYNIDYPPNIMFQD